MLDTTTKKRIDDCRDILVGKVPDPKSQIEQITIALIYKFMDDMDREAVELGGKRSFFSGDYEKYAWSKLFSSDLGGPERVKLYDEAVEKMEENPHIPALFRNIFKNAYLPYRDPETLREFLKYINEFTYDNSERLGDAFEYLLSVLGSQGDAGQFRTPRHIIDFMTAVIDPQKTDTILDPACGTAGFLISAYKHILKTNSSNYDPATDKRLFELQGMSAEELTVNGRMYRGNKLTPDERKQITRNVRGYDISPDMVRLSLVNLYLHGFKDPHIFEYDTLTSDDRWNEFYDVILANPPFMSPKGGIRPHKRFSVQSKRSEVLFVDYMAEHLNANGRAAIIVPEGIIFQTGNAYKNLRKMLVDENYLVGVISLPAGIFNPYAGVKTSILWLDKALARKTNDILFVKIENDGFDLGAQRRPIKENDLPEAFRKITAYKNALLQGETADFDDDPMVSVVSKKEIAENGDYNLSGERYKKFQKTISKYELVPLGEICKVINGRAYKQNELLEKGKYPVLRVGNFFSNRSWYYSDLELDENKYCEKGDLLYAWSASFGPKIWDGKKSIYHYHIWKMIPDEARINKKYLFHVLNFETEAIKSEGGRGIAMIHITKSGIEQRQIPLPPLSVQEEIVTEIEGYQKIIDGARQVADNYKPHIDIDPDWEMVELGEVCEIKSGGTPSRKEEKYWGGEIPWVGSTVCKDTYVEKAEEFITEIGLQKSSAKVFPKGTTLIALVGATIGKTGFLNFDCTTNQNIAGLIPKDEQILNRNYLFYSCQTLYPNFMKLGLGKFRMATLSFVREQEIPLPPLETQRQIVARIEHEQQLVAAAKELVGIFEVKIKERIGKVWGE